ncbi:MAG: HD-GYP domain-containing protein, partial [Armatimonadetes bacterium]|nr:HD-GYP domain-containing protein [Armatimonadota bacterium]
MEGRRVLAEDAVSGLARAMKNVSFYEAGHPMVTDVLKQVEGGLGELLRDEREFVVKFTQGYVVLQEMPIVSPQASIGNLVGACHRRGVQTIVLQRGVDMKELTGLVEVLARDPEEVKAQGGIAAALAERGARRIVVERLVSDEGTDEGERQEGMSEWRWVYTTALDVLRGAAADVRVGRGLDVGSVQSSVSGIVQDILGDRSIVYSLSTMKGMDEYTFVHALHICILSVELGRAMGLGRDALEELGTATMLHDVGKIFVPLGILRKPGRLTEEEFAVMGRHPIDGALVLVREPDLPVVAPVVAFEHHVHMDYSGYPKMRDSRELNMYSLMTSVVDVYDALTTARPYRPPLMPRTAVEVMRKEYEGRLEPRLLKSFLDLLGPYPWGTLLRLDDGRLAVVTRPNPTEPENPVTRLIEVAEGKARAAEEALPLRETAPRMEAPEVVDPVSLGIDLTELLHGSPLLAAASLQ